jgi:hypothetical protein
MLMSNIETLSRVLKVDLSIHSRDPSCWTAFSFLGIRCFSRVLDAFQGLRRCDLFMQAVWQGTSISIQEFTGDLRHRLRTVWRDVEGLNPQDTNSELATYHSFCSAI